MRPLPAENEIEVIGYYDGTTTTYRSPLVSIGGLEVEPEGEGTLYLSPGEERQWVIAEATEEQLYLRKDLPDEDENAEE